MASLLSGRDLEIETPRAFSPLLHPVRNKGVFGGRGSAKSHFFAGLLVENALARPGFRAVCIRERQLTLADSSKLLIEDKIEQFSLASKFRVTRDAIHTPGNGLIAFRGMSDVTARNIKSLEGFDVAWVDEAQDLSEKSLMLLRPTIRAPGSELWFSWNPTRETDVVDVFFRRRERADSVAVEVSWRDNPWLPDALYREMIEDFDVDPVLAAHVWDGAYLSQTKNALWTDEMLVAARIAAPPRADEFARIVVAIDPAVTNTDDSDETGIVVAGILSDGMVIVLDDLSGRFSPQGWGKIAVDAYERWKADRVVAEVNQGGDMVETIIRETSPTVAYRAVRASRGKRARAEPVAALYEQGRVKHASFFKGLERQMRHWDSLSSKGSPDRIDALVWAVTDLALTEQRGIRRRRYRGLA